MKAREFMFEAAPIPVLYHGTCPDSAEALCQNGWQPRSGSQGGNMGQARYLYLTSGKEDAAWFANEKGCSTIVAVKNVPANFLIVDPEDGSTDSVEDELNSKHGLPGKVALARALGPEHFEIAPISEDVMGHSDDEIIRQFKEGRCYSLALELNKMYRWPLWVVGMREWEEDPTSELDSIHAFVMLPDGRAFDVEGPQDPEKLLQAYSGIPPNDDGFGLFPVGRSELLGMLNPNIRPKKADDDYAQAVIFQLLRRLYPDVFKR